MSSTDLVIYLYDVMLYVVGCGLKIGYILGPVKIVVLQPGCKYTITLMCVMSEGYMQQMQNFNEPQVPSIT